MHEIALSTYIADIVSRAAGGRSVEIIRLEIGALRQVVPSSLEYAWGFVTRDTALAQSRLEITWIDAVVECGNGHTTVLDAAEYLSMSCPMCGRPVTVVAGNECRVRDIEVAGEYPPD